jgi:hypothetical protein
MLESLILSRLAQHNTVLCPFSATQFTVFHDRYMLSVSSSVFSFFLARTTSTYQCRGFT